MRTIKFRGQMEDKEWVFGSLITYMNGETYIVEHQDEEVSFDVDPKTVGQFTRLLDKNVKEIYEDDLVRDKQGQIYRVYYGSIGFEFERIDIQDTILFGVDEIEQMEIIGNIHDNPELITK